MGEHHNRSSRLQSRHPNLVELEESNMFKVMIDGDDGGVKMRQVHERIDAALCIRTLYKSVPTKKHTSIEEASRLPPRVTLGSENGLYLISDHDVSQYYTLQPWTQFASDVQKMQLIVGSSKCMAACQHRLGIMQERSRLFFLLNAEIEEKQNLRRGGGVFARVAKVDPSVTLSKSMDAQEVLDFVGECCSRYPESSVTLQDGTNTTLQELLQSFGVSDPKVLTVEGLGWQTMGEGAESGDADLDNFTALSAELRYIFLHLNGSYCHKLLRRTLGRADMATRSPQGAEYNIPIYGTYPNELLDIATSLQMNNVGPFVRSRWTLQVRMLRHPPDGYRVECKNFQDQLDNLFLPMLKATIAPSDPKNTTIAWFLQQVGAIQVEHYAHGPEKEFDASLGIPDTVAYGDAQNLLYYTYYIYANLTVANSLRKRKMLNTLQLRISANHRTGMDDLIGGYMLSDVITRGAKLLHFPVLQYLCGLHRVGLSLSPLRDHMEGVVRYQDSPLPNFLHRCLNLTISTESPMVVHHSPNALSEEYATAQKMFRLSALDMTELAYNSVVVSTFPDQVKREWLGAHYAQGVSGNEFEHSQVTNVRLAFREESWRLERNMLRDMYFGRVQDPAASFNRWHYLSTVREVEYNTVLDYRIRFPRTVLSGPKRLPNAALASKRIATALDMRHKYIWKPPHPWEHQRSRGGAEEDFQRKTDTFNEDEWSYASSDAVFISYPRNAVHAWPRSLPTMDDYHKDLQELIGICGSAEVKEFTHKRLELLDHKYHLHLALNHANEAGMTEERSSSNRDIYQATKVDTHIHMAAGMTPRQMLRFVLQKLQESADDIAMKKGDDILTLGQLFSKAGITTNLTVDQLSLQADHTLFERFDNFNNKYNPMGNGDLRSLLLKTDNFMNGRYFAELIHDVFAQYSRDKYTYAENRVSVYGIDIREWDKLSLWFATHGMSSRHNKWIIQVPRVYKVFRAQNVIGSFGQYLQNIFQPLWEASLHPSEHPTLHNFLKHVSGFDSVDNEATIDLPFTPVSPWAWTSVENPPYNYYLYYLYANIRTLNEFRASRGFSTFALRPHCGESGSDQHLYGAFLCANSICHGINLRNDPPMQYLYYLTQIGLHVSPLSNNALFLRFLSNPFPAFFRRGLNVSLSTDDPMMFHQTQEPLIEEYSIAARVWGLSPNDLCEIARNSVLQCGFGDAFKREAIGERWYMSSSLGNDPLRTHLSDIRVAYRFETYHTELQQLEVGAERPVARFMMTAAEEREINEMNQDVAQEEIILSTHDQEMEIMLRDIDGQREQIRVSRLQVDALRRQHHSIIENITDAGLRRKNLEEELRTALDQQKLQYTRAPKEDTHTFETAETQTVHRLLRWRPMPPNACHNILEKTMEVSNSRPLPPINPRSR